MHLLLPIRRNQPPLVRGRRGGRELCTTTLVDIAPLNQLTLTIAIRTIATLVTISMATRLRPVPQSVRLRHSLIQSLVGRSLWVANHHS